MIAHHTKSCPDYQLQYLEDYLAISCDAQVFELVEVLRSVRGIDVDESTVLRSLKRRGITRKKV